MAGFLSFVETPAEAAWHNDNAAAATQDQLDSTSHLFAATSDGGMLRVIDGKLYVWGLNANYGLGLQCEEDGTTTATTSTVIKSPMLHDYYTYGPDIDPEDPSKGKGFNGNIIKIMTSTTNGVSVLTDTGHIYSWGSVWKSFMPVAPSSSLPFEWDTSNIEGKIEDMYSSSLAITVKDSLGNWYVAGTSRSMMNIGIGNGSGNGTLTLQKISESNIDQLQPSYNPDATLTDAQQAEVDAGTKTATYYKVTTTNQREGQSGRWTIDKAIPSYGGWSMFIIAKSPDGKQKKLFSKGQNNHGQNLRPDVRDANGNWLGYGGYDTTTGYTYATEHGCDWVNVWDDAQNSNLKDNNASIDSLSTEGRNTSLIDASGNVWMVGTNYNNDRKELFNTSETYLYPNGVNPRRPQKVYDASINGSKCVKVFQSMQVVCFLTADNSVYAIGKNSNQFISTSIADNAYVTEATQVFTDLSTKRTITGVYVTSKGVMVCTKSGELYYAGDNTYGTAGNGDTKSDVPGTPPQEAIQPNVPVLEPSTENKVLFEIEAIVDDIDHTWMYDEAQEMVIHSWNDGTDHEVKIEPNVAIDLEVGSTFKLNVYFKDFGKINQWVLPIRFDRNVVQVCNGAGVTYDTGQVVSPGSIGASVGIEKKFTPLDWSEGMLEGEGGTAGGKYPKICNGGGWVSVMGHTEDKKANINGTVEMFSINFKVVKLSNVMTFGYATKNNGDVSASVITYDDSAPSVGEIVNGPAYLITPSDVTQDATAFSFKFPYWPRVQPYVTELEDMELKLTRADGSEVTDMDNWTDTTGGSTNGETGTALAISADSTSTLFYVKVSTKPTKASYPQVDWTYTDDLPYSVRVVNPGNPTTSEEGDGGTEEGSVTTQPDYLSNVTVTDTYVSFNITEGAVPKGAQVLITFEAETQTSSTKLNKQTTQDGEDVNGYATRRLTFMLERFEAPTSIKIVEDNDYNGGTYVYRYVDASKESTRRTFHVDFPGTSPNNKLLGVTWKVLDENHNDITGTSGAAFGISNTTPAQGSSVGYSGYDPNATDLTEQDENCTYYRPSATITPQHSTSGDTVVYLRVESIYNDAYDEVAIQVHLAITDIKFKQEKLHIPMGSSSNVSSLLTISPVDYWPDDVKFKYTAKNYKYVTGDTLADGTPATVGAEENVFQWSLPNIWALSASQGSSGSTKGTLGYHYAEVRATVEWLNGTKTLSTPDEKPLQVAAIKLTSPIMPSDIKATNVLGNQGDYVTVHGVQEGDIFEFSKNYPANWNAASTDDSVKTTITFSALTTAKISEDEDGRYFVFSVPGLMLSTNGEMCLRVTRNLDSEADADVIQEYIDNDDKNLHTNTTIDAEGTEITTYSYTYDDVPFTYDPEPSKVYGYVKLFGKSDSSQSNAGIQVQLVGLSNPDSVTTNENGYFEFKEYIIPGDYMLIASKGNYLTRYIQADSATGYVGITIPEVEKFAISTASDPIYLYPGDLNNDGTINTTDVNRYVREWVGINNTSTPTTGFSDYDFYDDSDKFIGMFDLDIVARFSGFNKDNYAKWYTPSVS